MCDLLRAFSWRCGRTFALEALRFPRPEKENVFFLPNLLRSSSRCEGALY